MNKILLVYEDYADLMSVEAALKRVGFDVIGLTSEYAMSDQMLAFNPDLVVGSGKAGKVSSLGVGKRLKENARWHGKSVLIFPANFKPGPQDLLRIRADMILEAPVPPLRLVQVIGRILGHDEAVLLERLNKAMHVESPHKPGGVGGSAAAGAHGGKPTPEGEAIYVKGTVEEKAVAAEEEFLAPAEERQGKDQEFLLSNEEDKEKAKFKFGDRMAEAQKEDASNDMAEAFPDVDLKALEQELLGGGTPEVERVEVVSEVSESTEPVETLKVEGTVPSDATAEVSGEVAPASEEQQLQAKASEELLKAEQTLKERVSKYSQMVAGVNLPPQSTITRVEARRRQKGLEGDWDSQNLKDQDELRREFTKALFKK
ncbi:ANTAR domain-containing protein [Bdellovibrio reynosensis]|uniref:Uncharacterized protein n=1 Tax=Bdellovibrio reynosensis TaxID=2835041 RepID=A0ABY4C9J7_9BACT|nr:hypothetical protein [Bdellovibrio reynosensis]UOF01656.1 hypothetical protein MNR06_01650 [Bdellovibrio reynosensis]